jgi:hypothetical protein
LPDTCPPHCPTCVCRDERGAIDVRAPFYGLVLEVDRIVWAEVTARHAAARAAKEST